MEAEKTNPNLMNVVEGKETLDEFVDKLPTEALIHLLGGQPNTGVANTFGMGNLPEYGIPNIMTADGPAGLRIQPQCGVNTTAWPCATLLACTWDPELIEEIGKAGGEEVKENNIGIWLTPAVNIHRSPLCGRNFEYYSEDPLVAGKSGAAMVRGMQSEHIGASVKHFCCNNKETNRKDSDSRVSERALREIYLKAFEIIVKEADPYTIMSSYNLINGVPTADSYDLCTNIARGEWGFDGLIMTDWNGGSSTPMKSMHAGNDMIMPGGAERAQNIVNGMQDAEPNFDERGQVAVDVQLMYGFVKVYSAKWNEFTPSAEGTKTVSTNLGEGYTATVADDGRILVNGEEIYLNYRQGWFNPGTFSVPATTDVVTVSNDGKTLTYKGEYVDNNIICLGDVQKSAINNLNIIMNSNMMQRRYGVEVKDYSTALGNLKAYQSVTKDSVQKASANVESLNKVIAMVEELNASDYTKASWAAVEEALNAAKAVAAKADATVIETTNAMTDLLAAMNSLEQGVEKTHLEISIKEAEKVLVRADKYSSLGNLEEAVANGKAVVANEDADQETVSAAATAILNELSKAVKNADLSSLESLI